MRTREWSGLDYYAELGVSARASRVVIDEAYRRRAKALHPDRNPDAAAEERFKRLAAAYAVLRDPSTREAYDQFRHRVDTGTVLSAAPYPGSTHPGGPGSWATGPTGAPRQADSWSSAGPNPVRRKPRVRRRLPDGVRVGLGYALIGLGIVAALWALVGDLPARTAGDTPIAVQITLGIMAAKLIACGIVVIKYPQLRARWHRPPGRPQTGERAAA
jgi:DnaJ domain